MLSIGIIWNSASQFKENILSDISEYGEVLNVFDLILDNQYDTFVRDIYSDDAIDNWKIDKKIETMKQSSDYRGVIVVVLNIDTTEQYYHAHKKRMVYANIDKLKSIIREKYSQLVSVYFFDNVFHLTDDEKEYEECAEILSKYTDKELIPNQQVKVKKILQKNKH